MSEVKQYTLNELAAAVILQLSRTANALESIEAAVKGGKVGTTGTAPATTGKTEAPKTETATAKKKREAEEAAALAAKNAPTATRADVNAVLIEIKDTFTKEDAQGVFKAFGYEAMSKIEDKDFDAILAAAQERLAELKAGGPAEEPEDDL